MADTEETPANGTQRKVGGKLCIYFDGYWIRYYQPPPESLAAKRELIDQLKKRLFHHTEPGINTPGSKVEHARETYEQETDPAKKRVKGAMLAGALFNRATDIFTSVVGLEARGVKVSEKDELLQQCGECFLGALELGKMVRHHSGHEGIDELWGEPLKAFALPIEDFYESRYVKLSQTMRDIDLLTAKMVEVFSRERDFAPILSDIRAFGEAAKLETETMRSDPAIFEVWPAFVALGDRLTSFTPRSDDKPASDEVKRRHEEGQRLLRDGKALLTYLAGVRTPMPKSTREYLERCDRYASSPPHIVDNPPRPQNVSNG